MEPLPLGYQPLTPNGAKIRADVIDVYVFTRVGAGDPRARTRGPARPYEDAPEWKPDRPVVCFLQLLRAGAPLENTWHPVMGHVHTGETSAACARREMEEELDLGAADPAILGLWALEQVHPFYIAAIDTVVMSPRFACEVRPEWSPRLNEEHTAFRWVTEREVDAMFMWPGQKACCREILREIVADASLSREGLRVRG